MFKRRAVDQRIFQPAAPSLPSPVPEGPAATSSAAELAYLDSDGAPHEGEQILMISASPSNPIGGAVLRQGGLLVSSAIHQALTSSIWSWSRRWIALWKLGFRSQPPFAPDFRMLWVALLLARRPTFETPSYERT
jgi:hypothetical protein